MRHHRADAQEAVSGGRAGRFLAPVRPGSGDVHPLRGQPTTLEQPVPCPRAGRDDGAGLREDGALGVRGDGDVAERHVHQDHQPQSSGLRHQDGAGGGRDQAVEQDEPAVRHARRPRTPAGTAPPRRAGATDRVRRVPARPSPTRELAAETPVVAIPAARSGGVVDAVGDDDMDGRHGIAPQIRPPIPSNREDARASRATGRTSSTRDVNRIVARPVSLGRTIDTEAPC